MSGAEDAPGAIADAEVHVWHGGLDHAAPAVAGLARWLSADERERAGRFRFERDRARYIAGRAQLRRLLAGYLDTDPRAIAFTYGPYGKPELRGSALAFNLAHSGGQLLVAVTQARAIGVDLELDDADFSRERIAEHFFSPGEVARLRALAPEVQPRAFLSCWTRKEAFIKARGDGLQLALDSFDVSLAPGQPVALLRAAWSHSEPTEWSLTDLSDASAGYVAAVAVRSTTAVHIVRRTLPPIDHRSLSEEVQR